jgi:hypothetical protein
MLTKISIYSIILFFVTFSTGFSADESSWSNLEEISPGQKIQVVEMSLKSVEGTFTTYNDRSVSIKYKRKEITIDRENVLRVSLRGPAKRKRRIITGLAIGAGAVAIIGLVTTRDDDGFEIISDEAIIFSLTATGGCLGTLVGVTLPEYDYRTIYRVNPSEVHSESIDHEFGLRKSHLEQMRLAVNDSEIMKYRRDILW